MSRKVTRTGRPPKKPAEKRRHQRSARFTDGELAALYAKAGKQPVGAYMREKALAS